MTADELIAKFKLVPLEPEGGYFSETVRAGNKVFTETSNRDGFTVIYFLLKAGQVSLPHKLRSNEIWFFHAGDPLELKERAPDGKVTLHVLGDNCFHALIPAGHMQTAQTQDGTHGFSLVSTVVIPGFDFADFELCEDFHCHHQ